MIDLKNGNCLEVMKFIPDKSINAIITDPPYGTTACKWDSVIDFTLMWEQLNRIIKPNGAIILCGSEPFSSALRMSNPKMFKYDWYWKKSKPSGFPNAKKMPLKDVETISVFYKKMPTYNPQGLLPFNKKIIRPKSMTEKGNHISAYNGGALKQKEYIRKFTNYPRQVLNFGVEGKCVHPTQKPIALMKYLVKTYTNEGETVLDFTMGSGSTGVAAKNLNRNFIGIEQDENYFNIATERINKEQPQKELF